MSQIIKDIRIQHLVDSKANWKEHNPILFAQEIGYEKDSGRYKIGNGTFSWNDLPYYSVGEPSAFITAGEINGEIFNLYQDAQYTYNEMTIPIKRNEASGKYSHAEGAGTQAVGDGSHTEGILTIANEISSHAEGYETKALGSYSHAEGKDTQAIGQHSHAEGYATNAISDYSNAKGKGTIAGCKGYWYSSVSTNEDGFTEIALTTVHDANRTIKWDDSNPVLYEEDDIISIIADSKYYNCGSIKSISNNIITLNEDLNAVLDGNQKYDYDNGFDGNILFVISKPFEGCADLGISASAEGGNSSSSDITAAFGPFSHAEGRNNQAIGHYSHVEGRENKAININAHAEGYRTEASGGNSHAEGQSTKASAVRAHAEGYSTEATGRNSHAEGHTTHAEGEISHAEGYGTWARGTHSHAEGQSTEANANAAHSEGESTHAVENASHAEGRGTYAKGIGSHAEGGFNEANGQYSHAEGYRNNAKGNYQHVEGKWALEDTKNKYAHVVGNGTDFTERSNAHTLDWDGNAWFAGEIFSQSNKTELNSMLMAPLYVGEFHAEWNGAQLLSEKKLPPISVNIYDKYTNTTTSYINKTINEIFNPALFDIIISWDDDTISTHYETIAEAGIQILSNGNVYIFNTEVEDPTFWNEETTLGVNVTVYYIGESVLSNISNE